MEVRSSKTLRDLQGNNTIRGLVSYCGSGSLRETVVYHAQMEIENAAKNYWKLKAVDSIQSSAEIGEHERVKLIRTILDDSTIENVLVKNQ